MKLYTASYTWYSGLIACITIIIMQILKIAPYVGQYQM